MEEQIDKNVICVICGVVINYDSSTASLIWHLTSKHDIRESSLCANKRIRLAILSESEVSSGDEEESKNEDQFRKNVKLNNKLINFLVACNLPISVVQMEEFVELMQEAVPNYRLPCRQTITKRLLPEKVRKFFFKS